ncbi:MAG: hypothetical protein RI928_863 [Pseudomonadota bacterium]
MANANTAGEVSLPETACVSKILMRVDALRRVLFEIKNLASQNKRSCGASAVSRAACMALIFWRISETDIDAKGPSEDREPR